MIYLSQTSHVSHVAALWLIGIGFCFSAEAGPLSHVYAQNGQVFESSELLLAGEADDESGIRSVGVVVQDRNSGLYLQPNGSWGTWRLVSADLSEPGGTKTRWILRQWLPAGDYRIASVARSSAGVQQPLADRVSRRIRVVDEREPLAASSRYLTLHFGRTQWGVGEGTGRDCTPYSDPVNGSVFLDEVAQFLSPLGYQAQGSVPFGHFDPDPNVRYCPWNGSMSASRNDLTMLRESHGWTFVADSIGPLPSNPSTRPGLSSLSCDDQVRSLVESLSELISLGHTRAWGLAASPNAGMGTGVRDHISSKLFSFTRNYAYGPFRSTENTLTSALSGDWAKFKSVSGGLCNDPSLDCFQQSFVGNPRVGRYLMPDQLKDFTIASPGSWRAVQFYRFVRGTKTPVEPRGDWWDCTSEDPAAHWTSRAELYCYEDFVSVMNSIYDEYPDVVTTDSAHVATSWGIGNPNHWTGYPICACQLDTDCEPGLRCDGGSCQ